MNDSQYFKFPLRSQQKKAFDTICSFVDNPDLKVFILKGYAGTGKTSLMSGLIKKFQEEEKLYVLLATTGRAAKILSDKTGDIAKTVHSCIYDFNKINEDLEALSKIQDRIDVDDTGQIRLIFDMHPIVSSEEIVYIVDEASMMSDKETKNNSFAKFGSGDLMGDLLKYDSKGKFIFVGDPCQLPPIEQNFSPALNPDYIQKKYQLKADRFELTDIVRQDKDNGIVAASLRLRQLYKTNPPVNYAKLPVKGYSNITLHSSHINLLNRYIHQIKDRNYECATMVCQTNSQCLEINNNVRDVIHNKPMGLVVGDLLMVTQNNYLVPLVNGDQVIVTGIGKREYRANLSFLYVRVMDLVEKKEYTLPMVEDLLSSRIANLNESQHKKLMLDFYLRMKKLGIKQNQLQFKDAMMKDPYLNALKAGYGYALTCHKSQGGEWSEVFLYLDNKIHGLSKPGIYQWWYTAITRAKNNLHVVNDWFVV